MASFWGELKRRNVFRVGIAYLAGAWLLLQVADLVVPTFEAPSWVMQALIYAAALGFPFALLLAWFYEWTPEGIKAASEVEATGTVKFTGRKLDFVIIGLLVLAVGFLLVESDVIEERDVLLANSVAVLPFENLSPDPDDAYFAAGIHEQVLNELVKISALNVIARTSVLQYASKTKAVPEIASELRVKAVMEGSVRFDGDQVRVTAQLIDGASGAHLWSEDYDGNLADVFGIQSDIAKRIAMAMEAELSPHELQRIETIPTDSPDAYEVYLKARAVPQAQLAVKHAYLDQAIAFDPDFALAYAIKANYYNAAISGAGFAGLVETDRDALVMLSRHNGEKAVQADPELGRGHLALAFLDSLEGRVAQAEAGFERALSLDPNSATAWRGFAVHKRRLGEFDADLAALKRAQELDPKNRFNQVSSAQVYMLLGDVDSAARNLHQAFDDTDRPALFPRVKLGLIEALRGNASEALEQLNYSKPRTEISRLRSYPHKVYALQRLGRAEEAERLFDEYQALAASRHVWPGDRAFMSLAMQDADQTLEWLNQSAAIHVVGKDEENVLIIKWNALSDPILDRPEFVEVRSRLMTFTD